MGLLDRLLGKPDLLAGKRLSELGTLFGGTNTAAGMQVTEDSALSLSAVFSAVRLLSQVLASLPLQVYQRQPSGTKKPATAHPAFRVLHVEPNPEMTAKRARETLEWNRLLGGNAYAEIQWDQGGNVRAYWPLEHWRVRPERDANDNLFYRVDGRRKLAPADMLHIPLVSSDGVTGQSFLDFADETLGLSLAGQEYAARFFGSGAHVGGVLEHPGQPTKESKEASRESWERRHQGPQNAHRVAVLWGGIKFNPDAGAANPQESQLLEMRVFQIQEVARFLGIPPHLLAELSRATYSNIEHESLRFVIYSMQPTAVDYEQEWDRKLLDPPALFCKHNFAGLLRGDSKARGEFYQRMFGIGAYTINRILEAEDENPIGPDGDVHFVPVNMQSIERATTTPAEPTAQPANDPNEPPFPLPDEEPAPDDPPAAEPPASAQEMRLAFTELLTDTLDRLLRKEANEARRAAKQPNKFLAFLDLAYGAAAQEALAKALMPVIRTTMVGLRAYEKTPGERAYAYASAHAENSRHQLLELAGEATRETLAAKVETLMIAWQTHRPAAAAAQLMEECDAQAPTSARAA